MEVQLRIKKEFPGEFRLFGEIEVPDDFETREMEYDGYVYKLYREFGGRRHIYIDRPLRRVGYVVQYPDKPFYVYVAHCPWNTVYVGATDDLKLRARAHRKRFGTPFLCILHVTDAKNVQRLENQEIQNFIKSHGAHNMRNRIHKSGYCSKIKGQDPLLTPAYIPPELDPMFQ